MSTFFASNNTTIIRTLQNNNEAMKIVTVENRKRSLHLFM
jgi:hypothetical protein